MYIFFLDPFNNDLEAVFMSCLLFQAAKATTRQRFQSPSSKSHVQDLAFISVSTEIITQFLPFFPLGPAGMCMSTKSPGEITCNFRRNDVNKIFHTFCKILKTCLLGYMHRFTSYKMEGALFIATSVFKKNVDLDPTDL